MSTKLFLQGLHEEAVKRGLLTLRAEIPKAIKKDRALGAPTKYHEELDTAARDVLEQMGWEPEAKRGGSGVEAVRDERQMELPVGSQPLQGRVTCLGCARMFAVPEGVHFRKCPDCGTIHHISVGEDGALFQAVRAETVPDDILQLMIRETSDDLAPLTEEEAETLRTWRLAHPDAVRSPETVEPGARLADPKVPGSGNPLRVECSILTGRECSGFETTDTPGVALCHKCGQKYAVELVKREGDGAEFAVARVFVPGRDDALEDNAR